VPSLVGHETAIGIAIILLFGALQWSGLRTSSRVQQTTSLIKAIVFLAFIAACFWFGGAKTPSVAPVRTEPLFIALVLAAQAIVLTYDGWYEALYFTEEIRDPVRQLPRSMIGGVAVVIVIYMLVNGALIYVLPVHDLAASTLPAADAAARLFGPSSARLITLLSLISLPPMISAVMLCAPRILFAMSRAKLFPARMSEVSGRGNPDWALGATLALAVGLVASGTFKTLIATASVIFVVNHVFALTSLFVLRRREPGLARPFQAWGYPWVTAVVLAVAVAIVAGSFVSDPRHTLYAAGLIAVSVPLYYFSPARKARISRSVSASLDRKT
jgi:APA family basic amino acid/polyamine antiporter